MELTQLRYFITIAETQSFTEAARRLHVSQPALSYQIKHLESELGGVLFHRTSRQVSLTVDGKAFLPLAQGVLRKADEAAHFMAERLGVERGEVTMGAVPSVGNQVIPRILASFRRNFPGVRVHVTVAGSRELEDMVLGGDVDFAIVSAPSTSDALEVTHLLVEELVVIAPPGHELGKRHSVSFLELQKYEWILPDRSFTLASQILQACERAGFEPDVVFETGSLESVLSFVQNDLGIGILPRLALSAHPQGELVVLPLQEPLTRDLNLVRAKGRYTSVAAKALLVHTRTTMLSSFPPGGQPTGRAGHLTG